MTSREWHDVPAVVFDRDERTCRRCGATDGDGAELRLYPVGDVPLEETVHESALVTVCSPCFASLWQSSSADSVHLEAADLFELVRETTQRQGVTVSAVASFASLATSLPGELEDGNDPDADLGYVRARREVLLAIDSIPSRLERLAAAEIDHFDDGVAGPLEELVDAATTLQTELRKLVALGETVAAGLGRCHGCFEPLETDLEQCPTCKLERRSVDGWRQPERDGVAFELLYDEVNDALQDASDTTETLTQCAATLAEQLQGESSQS